MDFNLGLVIPMAFTVISSGIAAYYGVRIAVTQLQGKIEALEKDNARHERWLDKLDARDERRFNRDGS